MKILITGAAGCLGRQLIQKLLRNPRLELYATDIQPQPACQDRDTGAALEWRQLDITSDLFQAWVTEVRPEVVIHLASVLQLSASIPRERAYEIDVVATETLVKLSVSLKVRKFVVTTSGAAYGYHPQNNEGEIEENRPTPGNHDYFYAAHKSAVECIMAEARHRCPELEQVVLRPGTIMGPDFDGPVVNLFEQRVITGLRGYDAPFNFIWSEDVVDYLIEAATTNIEGQFNVAGDGALSMAEIARKLNRPYLALPAWLMRVLLSVLKPLGLTRYGPEQVKFVMYRPVLSNRKIKTAFKHQPRYSSEEALLAFLKEREGAHTVKVTSAAMAENATRGEQRHQA